MGIWDWLSRKYFRKQSYHDVDSPKPDSCIDGCKYAVLDARSKYICFIKKHELRHNSVIHGCTHYTNKGEISGKILCPKCKSDLVERIHDNRFKCSGCGKIFS